MGIEIPSATAAPAPRSSTPCWRSRRSRASIPRSACWWTCRTRSSSTPSALGLRRQKAALPAEARLRHGRRLRLSEAGSGSDAFALATRAVERGDGYASRPQALDHQRQRGRPLHRLRHREPRRRLPRHHGVPRRARHAGLHGRQEGGQARHPRQQHLRAAVRGLRRPAEPCSARSGKGYKVAIETLNEGGSASARRWSASRRARSTTP
jgi:hypothetical protein